jgi:hypothetical protein
MATMLDCKKVQPLLSEYVDGTLAPNTAWDVKLHVASCAVCARIADELAATATLLQSLPTLEPSANFEAALAKRLADKVLTPKRPSLGQRIADALGGWWSRPALRPALASGVALAALLPAAFFFVHQGHGRGAVATPSSNAPVAADATTVDQLWREHTAYASAEPLGDPAGLLSTTNSVETL